LAFQPWTRFCMSRPADMRALERRFAIAPMMEWKESSLKSNS
jgi:hypothetical protein